jgi:hypothetical protein
MPALRFVVLDFAQVTGLDSTGLRSAAKMCRPARAQRLTFVLTGLSGGVGAQFTRSGFGEQSGVPRIFADPDHGLEWCESEIIAIWVAPGQAQRPRGPSRWNGGALISHAALPRPAGDGAGGRGLPRAGEPGAQEEFGFAPTVPSTLPVPAGSPPLSLCGRQCRQGRCASARARADPDRVF